jgi:hypothetical protein
MLSNQELLGFSKPEIALTSWSRENLRLVPRLISGLTTAVQVLSEPTFSTTLKDDRILLSVLTNKDATLDRRERVAAESTEQDIWVGESQLEKLVNGVRLRMHHKALLEENVRVARASAQRLQLLYDQLTSPGSTEEHDELR